MAEVLTAPRVMTGDETVADGAVVIGDRTVDWAGPAAALPAEYAAAPRTDYPDATILPGLIDSHVHLGFDGGPQPAERMRGEPTSSSSSWYCATRGTCSAWASPPPATSVRAV